MASSKKPTYKVETKLAIDRKRRKSDLVVMWHSIWDVTAIIIKELWVTISRMWEFIELWFSSSERFLLQTWLEKYLPFAPEDFSESWRDGRLLAILLNKLHPGCFPDANRLDPDYGLKNVYRVFDALETYFGVKPNVSVEEIVTCSEGADAELFAILLQLKNSMDKQPENEFFVEPEPMEITESIGSIQSCTAKGTGLAVAFVGRSTHFIIFCAVIADLDVVVEIRGPNTICSERITKRSPRKKNSLPSWECARHLSRSTSLNEKRSKIVNGENEDYENIIIPLEYEIIANQIRIGYKPKEKGKHKITILWHGQHVSESPYCVVVEDPLETIGTNQNLHLKSALKTAHVEENHELRKISVRFQESEVRSKKKDRPSGKVLSRRVLRYVVKIHGKDIPVNADSTESLATELLKMDYDFETCPSFHRRNSWGFAGEEGRKKSVIRQFGVDVKELDAQISQRRSNSLSLNTRRKRSLEKSDSFDCISSKLNILKEDAFEHNEKIHENECDYAYITEDFSMVDDTTEIGAAAAKDSETELDTKSVKENDAFDCISSKLNILKEDAFEHNERVHENECDYAYITEDFSMVDDTTEISAAKDCETELDTKSVKESGALSLSSELTESKCDKELRESLNFESQSDKISSLSTDAIAVVNVDSSIEDSSSNICVWHPDSECNQFYSEENYKCCGEELKKFDPENSEHPHETLDKKILKQDLKVKLQYRRKRYGSSVLLKELLKRKYVRKNSTKTFYKKVNRNTNSNILFSFVAFRKRQGMRSRMLNTKQVSSKILFSQVESDKALKNKRNGDKNKVNSEVKEKNIFSSTVVSKVIANEQNLPVVEKQCFKSYGLQGTAKDNLTSKTNYQTDTEDIHQLSKNNTTEGKVNRLTEHDLKAKAKTLSSPSVKVNIVSNELKNMQQNYNLETGLQPNVERDLNEFPKRLTQSETKIKDTDVEKSRTLRIHSLRSLGEFNFAQFKPALSSQNSISPIQLQIGQWERTTIPDQQKTPILKSCTSDIEKGSVKEKLAFWENTNKAEPKSSPKRESGNNRKMNFVLNKKNPVCNSLSTVNSDLQDLNCTGNSLNSLLFHSKEIDEKSTKETTVVGEKTLENKDPHILKANLHEFQTLSFSDPVVSDTSAENVDNSYNLSSLDSSQKEYCSSSVDDNFADVDDSVDSEDSGGDYVLHSTEDEYIDDEISERASEYWGDLSIVKGWKAPEFTNEYSFLGEEFLQNYYQRENSHPEECKVFGIAVYYGHVAIKNRFQVYTGDAGFGNLSVSMQGFRQHEVSLVSVAYIRNEIYEVIYQVMTAGYYLISIRWLDREIPGSPFVCKVTF